MYLGPRDKSFTDFIVSLLEIAKIPSDYLNILTSDESMIEYSKGFTSKSYDSVNNYEMYELLGDVTANKVIKWYVLRRFPEFNCSEGVPAIARLLIKYGAKVSFCSLAESCGFWKFISASDQKRQRSKKNLLEDTFEAFCGVTESILDDKVRFGLGHEIVYNFISSLFDTIEMPIRYTDLFDDKTILKEVFDPIKNQVGALFYTNASHLYPIPPNTRITDPMKTEFRSRSVKYIENSVGLCQYMISKNLNNEANYVANIPHLLSNNTHSVQNLNHFINEINQVISNLSVYQILDSAYKDNSDYIEMNKTLSKNVSMLVAPLRSITSDEQYYKIEATAWKSTDKNNFATWTRIGVGSASKQIDAEQKAAKQGLLTMHNNGYDKMVPEIYIRAANKIEERIRSQKK